MCLISSFYSCKQTLIQCSSLFHFEANSLSKLSSSDVTFLNLMRLRAHSGFLLMMKSFTSVWSLSFKKIVSSYLPLTKLRDLKFAAANFYNFSSVVLSWLYTLKISLQFSSFSKFLASSSVKNKISSGRKLSSSMKKLIIS